MNDLQLIKIARNIVALDAARLRTLQDKYDEEGTFDETVEVFEEMAEMIADDETLEEKRSWWQKFTKDYDPAEIEEQITTYIAGGLFIRAFKMIGQLIEAKNALGGMQEKINSDLSQMTKKELLSFAKEIRKEKRFLNKANNVIPKVQKIIQDMIGKAQNLKGSKKLKDIAKNPTVEDCVSDIVAALADAKEEIATKGISGDLETISNELQSGLNKIDQTIESGNYKAEEVKNNKNQGNQNINEKLEQLEGNTRLDKTAIETAFENILDDTKLGDNIKNQVKNILLGNVASLTSKTGKSEPDVLNLIDNWIDDGSNRNSLFSVVKQKSADLMDNLNNGKYKDFYTKLAQYINSPNRNFIIPVRDDLRNKLNEGISADATGVSNELNAAFENYKIVEQLNNIKNVFQEAIQIFNPEALRVTRTSSINKIARRIADSYK